MATTRIKDLTNTATTVASDEYLAVDGTTNGTSKITRDNFRQDTADAFVAAPGTYNLAPLSGGAVPIARGGTAATTAAGARTSLDVPSTSEAVLVANNLSDVTAATARTNLGVSSADEVAEGIGTKLLGPSIYFDGSTSDVTVATSPKFAFTDGTNDLPFAVEGWVKASTVANTFLFAVHESTSTKRQFACYISATNKLRLELVDSTGDACYHDTDSTLSAYDGQWIHVASVYTGAAAATFGTTAIDNVTHYVNGVAVASTGFPNASYGGMSDTGAVGYIGRFSGTRGQQHVSAVRVYNRALTAGEVAQLAKGNDIGFADEWGGATATSGTLTVGKRYRLRDFIAGDDFTNVGAASNADGVEFVATGTTPTTWSNSSVVESIGTLADFRPENYDESTGKLYDESDNAYVGVGTSVALTGRAYPVYETGTWTPSITFGGGSTGITYTTQEGLYTRVGNTVWVSAYVLLSAKGSDTGTALVNGLPFTASNTAASSQSFVVGNAANAANLTSAITAYATDNGTTINLVDWGATGSAVLDDTNFAATTALSITGTYQIQ